MRSLRMATWTSGDRCRRRVSCSCQSARSCDLWSTPPAVLHERPRTPCRHRTRRMPEKLVSRTRSTCYIRTTEGCKSPAPSACARPMATQFARRSRAGARAVGRCRAGPTRRRAARRRRGPMSRPCDSAARRLRVVSTTAARLRQHAVERDQRRRGTSRVALGRSSRATAASSAEIAAAGPPQRRQVRAGAEPLAEVVRERPHVEPGRAVRRAASRVVALAAPTMSRLCAVTLTGSGQAGRAGASVIARPSPRSRARAPVGSSAGRQSSSPRTPAAAAGRCRGTRRAPRRSRRATGRGRVRPRRSARPARPRCRSRPRAGSTASYVLSLALRKRASRVARPSTSGSTPGGHRIERAGVADAPLAERAAQRAPRRRARSGPPACRRRAGRPSIALFDLLDERLLQRVDRRRVTVQPAAFLWPPPPNSLAIDADVDVALRAHADAVLVAFDLLEEDDRLDLLDRQRQVDRALRCPRRCRRRRAPSRDRGRRSRSGRSASICIALSTAPNSFSRPMLLLS